MKKGISMRQRQALTAAALLPAAVGTLKFSLWTAGRLSWLCPWLAFPVIYGLCRSQRGEESGPLGEAPGPLGRLLAGGYLLWGTVLLWGTADGSAHRLLRSLGAGGRREVILLTAALLTFYLIRREQVLARAGTLFFPGVAILLLGVLALTLPALRWEALFPMEREELAGLPAGAAWVLSLLGYGVYAAFLPAGGEENARDRSLLGCAGLSALLLAVTGVFGPALALRMDEPFLYLLSGVGLPGAFQRGEALLIALSALGDLALMGLLAQGCTRIWRTLFGGGGWIPPAAGFALALFLPEKGAALLAGWVGLWGNLIFGAGIPALSVLTRRLRGEKKEAQHFVERK